MCDYGLRTGKVASRKKSQNVEIGSQLKKNCQELYEIRQKRKK